MRKKYFKVATRFYNTKADLKQVKKVFKRNRPREWRGARKEEKA